MTDDSTQSTQISIMRGFGGVRPLKLEQIYRHDLMGVEGGHACTPLKLEQIYRTGATHAGYSHRIGGDTLKIEQIYPSSRHDRPKLKGIDKGGRDVAHDLSAFA